MQLVGLTGGIAAGKSTIASQLSRLGANVIDADDVAREVVAPGSPALERIRERFGEDVVSGGQLDRTALAQIVFEDPGARHDLERITHPAVRAKSDEQIEAIAAENPEAIVVYDVPLLVETQAADRFDLVVVAHSPASLRTQRLQSLRGMSAVEARRRVDAQATDAERLAVADAVIDTSGTLEETAAQVDALWQQLVEGRQ